MPVHAILSLLLLLMCCGCYCGCYHTVRDLSRTPVISASSKTLTFYNKDTRGEIQRASFNEEQVKRIFHGSFHKVDTTHNSMNKEHCVRNIITLL